MAEQEQKQKKKSRKKKEFLLLTDYECLTQEEIISSISDMRKRLKEIFRTRECDNSCRVIPTSIWCQSIY